MLHEAGKNPRFPLKKSKVNLNEKAKFICIPGRKFGSPSVPHPPQFNTSVPHKMATPFQHPKFLSSTPKPPQFNTTPSVPHQKPLSTTPKPPQFNTKNPSVPPPLSSTPKTPQFHTPLSSTPKTPQFHLNCS